KLGFKTMDALDPSSGMLEKAKKKGLYRNYYCEGITSEPLNIPKASYDVVTVVGGHGPNHIKGDAVHEMIRLVKSGGYVCIVTRRENFERMVDYKDTFFPMCDRIETDGKWRKVVNESCPFFPGVEGICLCYQIC
ncbi:hypothetical protein FSP39_012776, partial [Pinctada imbricata]